MKLLKDYFLPAYTDVSTGVLLSGGIDSSLITSISSLKKTILKHLTFLFLII